jgi:hypothetical protein
MHRITPYALVALAALATPAAADTLFSADFESTGMSSWTVEGAGIADVTEFAGNHSLHLTAHATAIAHVDTSNYATVSVGASLAALGLEDRDACIASYSIDNGENWERIIRVEKSGANGTTLYPGRIDDIDVSKSPVLLLRMKASLKAGPGIGCWADAITVTGVKK